MSLVYLRLECVLLCRVDVVGYLVWGMGGEGGFMIIWMCRVEPYYLLLIIVAGSIFDRHVLFWSY